MSRNKIGRNELCPCGSGRKYKKCCLNKKAGTDVIKLNTPEVLKMTEKERQLIEKSDTAYQTEFGKDIMKRLKNALKTAKMNTELPKRFPSEYIIYEIKKSEEDLKINVIFDLKSYEEKHCKKATE